MADFQTSFKKTSHNEGEYANDPLDPGGETYRGIARNRHPKWRGWKIIDSRKWDGFNVIKHQKSTWGAFNKILSKLPDLQDMVVIFYKREFWDTLRGDDIVSQDIADSMFDFGVNSGVETAVRLAQISVKAKPDGDMGPDTLGKLNAMDPRIFVAFYTLSKCARYIQICKKRPESKKFFFNWISRALEEV